MKFAGFTTLLLAVPALASEFVTRELNATERAIDAAHMRQARELEKRTFCALSQHAGCYTQKKEFNPFTCGCKSLSWGQSHPSQKWGSWMTQPWSTCKDISAIVRCWQQGQSCDNNGNCYGGNKPNPPSNAVCNNWLAKAKCFCRGMSVDGNCNCVPGKLDCPGPDTQCRNPDKLAQCWAAGNAADHNCNCLTPPPTVGKCTDIHKIIKCGLTGGGVNADCSCNRCSCWDQWRCCLQGGQITDGCKCTVPSRGWKRRDQTCPTGLEACPIGGGSTAAECIDTKSSLESCGGCASTGEGQDCSAIEGVSDVACIGGKCVVSSCRKGFTVGLDNSCVPVAVFQQ